MSVEDLEMEVDEISSADSEVPQTPPDRQEHNSAEEPRSLVDTNKSSHQNGRARPSTPVTPSGRKRKRRNATSEEEDSTPTSKRGRRKNDSENGAADSPGRRSIRKSGATAGRRIRDAFSLSDEFVEGDEEDMESMDMDEMKENQNDLSDNNFTANGLDKDEELRDEEFENRRGTRVKALAEAEGTPSRRGRRPSAVTSAARVKAAKGAQEETSDTRDILGVKNVEDEDPESECDEKGELKITKDGELLGGRDFRIKTFTLPRHPTRRYMLTVDIAKTLQYRDTYIFFLKNPHITRIQGTDEDKKFLEEAGLLPGQLRRRPVSIATARSIFRAFGHKAIKRGRAIRDDYWVGDQEEPPEEPEPEPEEQPVKPKAELKTPSTRESTALRRQASRLSVQEREVLHRFASGSRVEIPASLNGDDHLYRRAASAADFNRRLIMQRPRTFLDSHTNIEQIPSLTQPTHISVQVKQGTLRTPLTIEQQLLSKEVTSDGWCNLPIPELDEKFPIAVIPGQYQGTFSIYQKRFAHVDLSVGVGNDLRMLPATIASSDAASGAEQTSTPQLSGRIRHLEHVCGEITRSGLGCKRPVYNAGEKCLYHVKAAEQPSRNPDACVHCHSIMPKHPIKKVLPVAMLTCASCKTKHHPSCIDFDDAVLICKAQTYKWHCSDCKTCVICNQAGDDDKLLFCDTCDRGYHTYCLTPPLDGAPEGNWLCEQCAVCISCKARPPPPIKGQASAEMNWKHAIVPPARHESRTSYGTYICTYCEDCYVSFERDKFCPLCMHVYSEDDDTEMACCDSCDRWIHVGCDPELTEKRYQQLVEEPDAKYTCVLCDGDKLEALIRKKDGGLHKVVEYKGKTLVAPPVGEKNG
ncbi:uncharacterized protein SPPG_03849 [Spizellomyces punctatus DAOM BR117]|uniref:PHD-type domain-containing protein n=1 Tax=Spizellomyces punctatus (strain DAOM BR117) TaxID=645134 RepID=A0A0L0HI07_SPIPD|nr:uncharacterized protein SPPG_03849 [Spizellomyces punctatus DAOM BR117]KND00733.1 hypothetical protein SPPG_03849 [Spizellomyces punctatus DAOM BR117]|eukprot:XP_016608772.1 hypothetical protein SPPG_03849 [Spizellomyces punctatus DAOM BR117]